jgi:uroporphyrin-III C-methyltransferase/precorrin-2 dehydrogenase/sirohydrochlorin ferrochelatase
MGYYPVFLDLLGRQCLVIGGGNIGSQRAHGFVKAGAAVTVISPKVSESQQSSISAGTLRHYGRPYRDGDLRGFFLACAATGVPAVDAAIAGEARRESVLFNAADRPALCDFITPALVERGDLTIAVSTNGECPGFAKRVRQKIESLFGSEFGAALEVAAAWRKTLLVSDVRLSEDIRRQRQEQMLNRIWPRSTEKETTMAVNHAGKVYLVGAGPGDPELLTLKGKRCLEQADVILFDELANRELLQFAGAKSEWIYVGKKPGAHCADQKSIEGILVAKARAGKYVVRLKGGDPLVFGRGGEEAQALQQAGIPFEIVPGISSAIAVPAYAGIPITHRDCASSVAFVAGHQSANRASVDWARLARSVDTLVIVMGLQNLADIMDRLLKGGCAPDHPVMLIQSGTLPSQRTLAGTVETIAGLAAGKAFASPVTIVVGNVVRLAEELAWFQHPRARLPRAPAVCDELHA